MCQSGWVVIMSRKEVFTLGEDRPTVARLLLSLDPSVVRVFSLKDRKDMLDLLEKTYPEYLSPATIADRIDSDNKSVSNALNYLEHSTGMIESRLHEYRLAQTLMRPVEGRFEKVSYGTKLVLFFTLATALLVIAGMSSPLLALVYLALCIWGLYSFSKRKRNNLFISLVALMIIGEAGYALWHVEQSREVLIWMRIVNDTRATLLQASQTARTLNHLGPTVTPEDRSRLAAELQAHLDQAATLLNILASTERQTTSTIDEVSQNLHALATANTTKYMLNTDRERTMEKTLARIADVLGRSVKSRRTWIGTDEIAVDNHLVHTAETDTERLLETITQTANP